MVREVGLKTGSEALATNGLPVTTAEVPWGWTQKLAAAADLVAVNINPFYAGPLDTTSKK